MRWNELVEQVRERGRYTTAEEAERVTRTVLTALGGHLAGPERADLARLLPAEAAALVTARIPMGDPLTAAQFVDGVAARTDGATTATARWDVSSVLGVVADLADLADRDLLDRLIARLPAGYALLLGRAQLV